MTSYVQFWARKLQLTVQLGNGQGIFVKDGKKLKMNHDPVDL
jgi:hypothetical protein